MITTTLKKGLILAAGVCLIACAPASQKIERHIMDEQDLYESEEIENIEMKIISAKEDSDKFKKLIKIARLNISITEKKLKVLELEKLILKDKQKLYTFVRKTAKKNEAMERLEDLKDELMYQLAKLEFLKAKQDNLKNMLKLKELELDLKISQRFLEKAKMAQKSKKQENLVSSPFNNLSGYELNCKEKERAFLRSKKNGEETIAIMKEAEADFKPMLKKDECETVKKLLEP